MKSSFYVTVRIWWLSGFDALQPVFHLITTILKKNIIKFLIKVVNHRKSCLFKINFKSFLFQNSFHFSWKAQLMYFKDFDSPYYDHTVSQMLINIITTKMTCFFLCKPEFFQSQSVAGHGLFICLFRVFTLLVISPWTVSPPN